MTDQMLYRYELRGIQAFIFRSSRLKHVAAASALVDDGLNKARRELADQCGGEVITAAAGSATLVFPTRSGALQFAERWPLIVGELLPGPELVCALGRDLAEVGARLVAARNHPIAHAFDAGPLVARAASSGRPAVGRVEGAMVDRVVRLLERASKVAGANPGGADRLTTRLLEGSRWGDQQFLRDNRELGGANGGENQDLALVHADGNGIGKAVLKLAKQGDADAFRRFSEALSQATLSAARDATHAVLEQAAPRPRGALPIRPIVVGGDDVTFLLPAEHAFLFTHRYLDAFERHCRASKEATIRDFTACAAVVYCKVKAPFYAVHEVCESLCGWVKQHSGRSCSALAVHRITASPLEPFSEVRERSLRIPAAAGSPFDGLLGGPYRLRVDAGSSVLPTIASLDALAGLVSKLPKGGVRGWLREVQVSPERAVVLWNRLDEVCGEVHRDAWSGITSELDRGFWKMNASRTPLLDALHLNHAHRAKANTRRAQSQTASGGPI